MSLIIKGPCQNSFNIAVHLQGANSYGQLGQGDLDDRLVPTPIGPVPGRLTQISCGGGHTLLRTGCHTLHAGPSMVHRDSWSFSVNQP